MIPVVFSQKLLQPDRGLAEITFGNNVVTVENTSGLVPSQLHCNHLRNSGSHKVPYGGAPEVMHQPSRNTGIDACSFPRSLEFLYWLARPEAFGVKENPWSDFALFLQHIGLGPLLD
jgi:hypothetical protein